MALANNYKMKDDQDIYYAEVLNQLIQSLRENYIISGGAITGTATPLTGAGTHAQVSSGDVVVGGTKYTLSSLDIDLSTEYATLTTDEGIFIYIYATSTGAVAKLSGTKGSNSPSIVFFPPDFDNLPADSTLLGRILLSNGDNTVDAEDIFDMRVNKDFTSSSPSNIGTSNSEGSNVLASRVDHVHAHPGGLGTSLHHTKTVASELNHQDIANRGANDHHTKTVASELNHQDIANRGVSDHHTKYALLDDLTAVRKAVLLEIDWHFVIGSGNWAIKPVVFMCGNNADMNVSYGGAGNGFRASVTGTRSYIFSIPLETNKGSKKLHIKRIRYYLNQADGSNYISEMTIYGGYHDAGTEGVVYQDTGNKTSAGAIIHTFTEVDVSGYDFIYMNVKISQATSLYVEFMNPTIDYYYDT